MALASGNVRHLYWVAIAAVLLLSFGVRVVLVFRGGQGFWPDEARYDHATNAVHHFSRGEWKDGARSIVGQADHTFFRVFSLVPAIFEHAFGRSPKVVASYFSAFTVVAIGLLAAIVRRAGGSWREAFVAVSLAAASTSLLFYERHYFPYDIALAVMLVALWMGLGAFAWWRSFATGAIAGVGFLTYNGYWLLGGTILVLHVIWGAEGVRRLWLRALFGGVGLILPIFTLWGLGTAFGFDLVRSFQNFARTVIQGDFYIGYRVVAEYLWHAEGLLFVAWMGGAVGAAIWIVRNNRMDRLARWLSGALFVGGGLVIFSDVVPKFVVYGRLARCLTPFFCLITAYVVEQWASATTPARRRIGWTAGYASLALVAALNFAGPFRQMFPDEFRRVASVEAQRRQQHQFGIYQLVRSEFLWGTDVSTPLPPHRVLMRKSHPLQFRPYQYEAYSAAERAAFNEYDISMRLIERLNIPVHGTGYAGYPGPLRLRVRFARGRNNMGEPLLTSGEPQRAQFFYVRHIDERHIRIGYDCWGAGAVESESIAIDYAEPHEVLLFSGAQLPEAVAIEGLSSRLRERLREDVIAVVDGQLVLMTRFAPHSVRPSSFFVGSNFVGGSTTREGFSGEILEVARVSIDEVTKHLPFRRGLPRRDDLRWSGAAGPVRLRVRLPSQRNDRAEPLLSVRNASEGELLFVQYVSSHVVRLGFLQGKEQAIYSEPLTLSADRELDLTVAYGSAFPDPEAPIYRDVPALRSWTGRLQIAHAHRDVLNATLASAAGHREITIGANETQHGAVAPFFLGTIPDVSLMETEQFLEQQAAFLIAKVAEVRQWSGYPGPIFMRVKVPDKRDGLGEPLLVSGDVGAGDFVYLRYLADGTVRFGWDHWGSVGVESAPMPVPANREFQILISTEAMLPRDARVGETLRGWLILVVNGRSVLVQQTTTHLTQPKQIFAGFNPIGGSTTSVQFSGEIFAVEPAPISLVESQIQEARLQVAR